MIRQVRPERVLTWTPEWSWRRFHRNHPDHRAVGEAVLGAVSLTPESFAHPELLKMRGWSLGTLTRSGRRKFRARTAMSTSPTPSSGSSPRFVPDKSQTGHRDSLEADLRKRLAPNSQAAGLAPGHLAEAFQVVTFE